MTAIVMTWSPQQERIFDWFETSLVEQAFFADRPINGTHADRSQHLIVRARAGTGKSTTIREGVKRVPRSRRVLIAAFSRDIKVAMEKAFGPGWPNVDIMTLHAVGYACVRSFRERIQVAFDSDRADALALAACGRTAPDAVVRLVSKLHTKGREIAPHAAKPGDLTGIAITFECEPSEQWEKMGYGLEYVERKALDAMDLAADVKSGDTIDGSDMIFLPVRNGWLTPQFDDVVVDEAQDMTTAQLEIAQGVLRPGGRICVVGDDRQAIFGFRGADSGSLDRLKAELDAAELCLTTTYRCGKAIVELARRYVPDYAAGPENPDGEVLTLHTSRLAAEAGPGDYVLSRVNAPLVSIAMQLLRAGKRAQVAGRDIGKGLQALVRRLKARSVPDFLAKVESWAAREESRLTKQMSAATNGRRKAVQAKIEAVRDQADMLAALADGARGVSEVEARIDALFTDDGSGIEGVVTCSSVHRAKGQERDRVFILRDTLRDAAPEEENISYVAITRAKRTLVWVADDYPVQS